MATTYKSFLSNDIANTRTLLHEAIPITGSIISGTYTTVDVALGSEFNIKTYGHGIFESVYDYPYLSSSANHIFDITCGFSSDSPVSGTSVTHTQVAKKINIYNEMAQYLVGYDHTGTIKQFTLPSTNKKMKECYFVPFSRLLSKDEIKKGSFTFELSVTGAATFNHLDTKFHDRIKLTDTSGSNGYNVDSPAGEYGELFASTSASKAGLTNSPQTQLKGETLGNALTNPAVGLLYYQAGIAVVSGGIFDKSVTGFLNATTAPKYINHPHIAEITGDQVLAAAPNSFLSGATIQQLSDGLRNRIHNISYNNTTELNSTIYFCRANHNDFNYSSNPTYLTGSKLRVKTRSADAPVTYITTVGLYSADNELLAVAKLSEPLRKDPTNELTLRVRLDY